MNLQGSLLSQLEQPNCSICNLVAGVQIATSEDLTQMKFSPFDHRFDFGVTLYCPECKQSFESMTAVEYYRALARYRESLDRLVLLLVLCPVVSVSREGTIAETFTPLPSVPIKLTHEKDQS